MLETPLVGGSRKKLTGRFNSHLPIWTFAIFDRVECQLRVGESKIRERVGHMIQIECADRENRSLPVR